MYVEINPKKSNVDSQSPLLWDKVAENYSDTPGISEIKLAEEIQQILLELEIDSGSSLLEVGCGSGHLSGYLADKGFKTTLLDFSSVALEKAKKYYESNDLTGEFIQLDMFDLSPENLEKHDVVWNSGVLEHLNGWQVIDILKKMSYVAKKYVIVLVPNSKSIPYLLFRQHAMENNEWVWGRELLRDSLSHLAEVAGLDVVDELYIGKNFSYDHMNYVNSKIGQEYESIDQQKLIPTGQNYLIALIARHNKQNIDIDYTHHLENVVKKESFVENNTYNFDCRAFKSCIEKVQGLNQSLISELDDKDSRVLELQTNLEKVSSELDDKDFKVLELQTNLEKVISELDDKDSRVLELQTNLEKVISELDDKDSKVLELQTNLEKVISELEEKHNMILCVDREKKDINIYIKSLEDELERIHSLKTWKVIVFFSKPYSILIDIPRKSRKFLLPRAGKIVPNKVKRQLIENVAKIEKTNSSMIPEVSSKNVKVIQSNEIQKGVVNIVAPTFFNFSGNDMFFGGAERYIMELVGLCRSLGYEVNVYQNGTFNWVRFYNDIKVFGLNSGGNSTLLNELFHHEIPQAELTIYLAFFLAYPCCYSNSIGISHGIYWDHECIQRNAILNKDDNEISKALSAIKNCETMVSVDTNTINWIRAIDFVQSEKFEYVPNFVDLTQFSPKKYTNKRNLVVLYPRRLYQPRGFWLVEENIEYFISKYGDMEFHFVGKADEKENIKVLELTTKYPNNIKWYNLPPEKMHEAYDIADIVLVPTINSEGTSLSCLEAMASGNAIIATNVGGLPNLIIDGYNGLLIEPQSNELKEKLELLIEDQNLREKIQNNAVKVSKQFSKDIWIEKWKKILSKNLTKSKTMVNKFEADKVFVHVGTPGISWDCMKQRPQQLCEVLAKRDIQTFFVSENGKAERDFSSEHLQIISEDDDLYLDAPILYIYYPYNYAKVKKFKNAYIIYDILDDIDIHSKSDTEMDIPENETALHYHKKLISEADIVITTATNLHAKYKKLRDDIVLIPNGVDYEHFNKKTLSRPSDFPSIDSPVIGYYGAIAEWMDYDLIDYMAEKRSQYLFVFIGPISDKKFNSILSKHKNIIHLGVKKYEELPDYLHYFDVATIPFKVNSITRSTSPVKLFEYMAGKKPIVTTNMDECKIYNSVMNSKTYDEFVNNLDIALDLKNDKKYLNLLSQEAKENTWEQRAGILIEIINQKLQTT